MSDNEQQELDQWMLDNYIMLTEWLTNIVMIKESEAKQTPSIFQTFIVDIMHPPPQGLILAGNDMKQILILHAVFGIGIAPVKARELAPLSSKAIGDYTVPGMFSGFKQQTGRLPMKEDVVLFTATKWFEIGFKSGVLIGSQGHSTLECVCTIDCLPRDAAIS